uniref:Claudin n=1 Tax=Ficedula albicollis TaxID=59894 RepID=A0A803V2B2_FICAL
MASSCLQICALLLALAGFTTLLVTTVSSTWKALDTETELVTADWVSEGLWMDCAATAVGSKQCKRFLYMLSSDLIGATLPNNYWKVSSIHGSVITTSTLFENLWKSCAEDSTGVSNCRDFDSMLALPAHIQACRALMITSILLGFLAAVLTLLGMKCTNIGLSDEDGKMKFAVTGGFLFVLAGLCSMVAISWYAAMVTAQFFNQHYAGTKYELGEALYLGWAGSVLYILGGILLTCSCRGKENQNYSPKKYTYSAAQAASQRSPEQPAAMGRCVTVFSSRSSPGNVIHQH